MRRVSCILEPSHCSLLLYTVRLLCIVLLLEFLDSVQSWTSGIEVSIPSGNVRLHYTVHMFRAAAEGFGCSGCSLKLLCVLQMSPLALCAEILLIQGLSCWEIIMSDTHTHCCISGLHLPLTSALVSGLYLIFLHLFPFFNLADHLVLIHFRFAVYVSAIRHFEISIIFCLVKGWHFSWKEIQGWVNSTRALFHPVI